MKRKPSSNQLVDAYNAEASDHQRKAVDLLPAYIQTDKNKKFLSATLDKLIEVPQIERINGYVGSTLTPTYNPETDTYLDSTTELAKDYQLEPAMVIKDEKGQITKAVTYDDFLKQLEFSGAEISNHNRILKPKTFTFNPHIDLDKFVNYNQYYWLEAGPDPVQITGPQKETVSTYTVTDNTDGTDTWLLSPDGLTPNPLLTLYRGMTYVFNVTSKHSFYIKTAISYGKEDQYEKVVNNGKMEGQVILTVDDTTPPVLFYVAGDDNRVVGRINVKKLVENTQLDVEKDILGKKTYRSGNNVEFTNGLMVYFTESVIPASYRNRRFLVQGVGRKIVLVDFDSLQNNVSAANNLDTDFDVEPFDKFPFDDFSNAPITPEYITINRASVDLNPWTRYNRWFHKDVITTAAKANGVDPVYPVDKRAQRPIIEFDANIKLYNFGLKAMPNVHLIDNTTLDAFSKVEKSAGYYIDGILLEEGYRVIFNADTDPLVRGRVYEVKFEDIEGNQRINLVEDLNGVPFTGASIVTANGKTYKGASWHWDDSNSKWILSQQKSTLNQAPVFDLFDENGISFGDINFYQGSFSGTKIFGYAEGTVYDSVLGLNLKFLNVANIGDFLFTNYFNTDTFVISNSGENVSFPTSSGYLKITSDSDASYVNVWEETVPTDIPILQYNLITEVSNNVEITAIDFPGWTANLNIEVWLNDKKQKVNSDFYFITEDQKYFVAFNNNLNPHDRVLCKIYTNRAANKLGYYEPSLALTNNPKNGPIGQITLAQMSDHYKTICERWPDFVGEINGINNFRDAGDICHYGTRLISHQHPISFAQFFLGQKEYNIIPAIRKVAYDYFYYKNSFIYKTSSIPLEMSPVDAVDKILTELNLGKDVKFPYGYSDMLTYGKDFTQRTYTVSDTRVKSYSLSSPFNTAQLNERSVLVYLNDEQLLLGRDYSFDPFDPSVTFLINLAEGDVIVVRDYPTTEGCYVPPTPTKLGLFPKFEPLIYIDDTYVTPTKVIQGHDGSITVAFNDYRDDIILEFEKRIYNNIKSTYNTDLVDINEILPGAYRSKNFSYAEIMNILSSDFLKWAGNSGVDYSTNALQENIQWTYNFRTSSKDKNTGLTLPGYWRGVYKYFYDTDRPHSHPWEMLGFSEKPSWWESEYGAAPYTSGNKILWSDLRDGVIKQGPRAGIDSKYARANLFDILPVDEYGNLLDPIQVGIAQELDLTQIGQSWKFGDCAPAETAWRRSSLWPFAVQVLMALTKPGAYASLMFDPSRIKKSVAGQYSYGDNEELLKLDNVILYRDVVGGTRHLASGYSVLLIESGLQRTENFLTEMKDDIANINYQLMYKAEGFINKDKLRVIIDSVDPTSTNPGVLLPQEDYDIVLTTSNPIATFNISGVLIQKDNASYIVRGYDKYRPYFKVVKPIHSLQDRELRVGGKSESYVTWTEEKFYQTGQVVFYNDSFYRTVKSHTALNNFDTDKFQKLPSLPITGGLTVARAVEFTEAESIVPYGTRFSSIQEVVDFILGYGRCLENQGFVFDYLQPDFGEILNWEFSAREFMFWTTQNWTNGSIITLSPFAQQLKFSTVAGTRDAIYGVVDDITNQFYEYSLLTADGSALPHEMHNCSRIDDEFVVEVTLPKVGLYFAQFNLVQKQHALVFDNFSMFNDIIYDIETGYRQRRAKLIGFRTSEWNGGLSSPGFVFDEATINDWQAYKDYYPGEIVRYNGRYYTPKSTEIYGSAEFNFSNWNQMSNKPAADLIPNFEYKINQFEDFYSLDIDNFDVGQQRMAQHLTGYSPRSYLDNIFNDPIAQYKFYQGYIREKGTANAINKIAKATVNQLKGEASFNEAWAFRIGHFGGYNSYQELEIKLDDNEFVQNPQIIKFTDYNRNSNDFIYYKPVDDILVKPEDYDFQNVFPTTDVSFTDHVPELPVAGYVRIDDVTATAFNRNSLLDIGNVDNIAEGSTFWVGFREDGDWDVLRYTRLSYRVIDFNILVPGNSGQFLTSAPHGLQPGDLVAVSRYKTELNRVYSVLRCPTPTSFVVATDLSTTPFEEAPYVNWSENAFFAVGDIVYYRGDYYKCTSEHTSNQDFAVSRFIRLDAPPSVSVFIGQLFKFVSVRFASFDDLRSLERLTNTSFGDKIWVDDNGEGKFVVYEKINNYQPSILTSGADNTGQLYGFRVSIESTTSTFAVSAPTYEDINYGKGLVTVYERSTARNTDASPLLSYRLNDVGNTDYYTSSIPSNFGFSLKYDKAHDLIFAGAPNASQVKAGTLSNNVRYADPAAFASSANYAGLVKITHIYRPEQDDLTLGVLTSPSPTAGGQFGYDIAVNTGSVNKVFLVGAPGDGIAGKVYVYHMGGSVLNATVIGSGRRYTTSTVVTISGPDLPGGVNATARISSVTAYSAQELQDNPTLVNGQILSVSIDNPGYGYVNIPTIQFDNTNGLDAVVEFELGVSTSTQSVFANPSQAILPSAISVAGSKFGYSIGADNNLTKVAVGAPGYITNTGAVEVFVKNGNTYSLLQTIDKNSEGLKGVINYGDNFGAKVVMTRDGNYIFVSAPGNQTLYAQGIVSVWKWNGTNYSWLQNIENPNKTANTVFGTDICIDEDNQNLVITGLGDLYSKTTTFDTYTEKLYSGSVNDDQKFVNDPSSSSRTLKTTFDGNSTKFYSAIRNAGQVSVFNRYNTYFSYAQDLDSVLINENSNFGLSVTQSNDHLYVGAPTATTEDGPNNGEILIFVKQDTSLNSWAEIRKQDSLIDVNAIKKAFTIDVEHDRIQDYLSIIDPMKGKISGAADQELTYKTMFDPAVYSLGNSGVTVDSNTNWIDDNVGQLWWDTGSVKYIWYEQGDLEYRKNNWGATFPGSSISVYEWVRSEYLPSEWASIADTNEGLIKGISGQPKYPDNSVLSIKQVYNSITQQFTNVYYYWVKNKVNIPSEAVGRRLSALAVAGLIADPKGQNVKAINILSKDSISLVNIKETIQSSEVNLHLNIDTVAESAPRHTEWLLLQENDEFSVPPVLLERKLIDSLSGFDALGNSVPDTSLSANQRYGISIRPRQSMFVNRLEALRNLITWTNSVLLKERVVKLCEFDNLNAFDQIPDELLNEYDVVVEDNYVLSTIITRGLQQAELACTITKNGQIDKVVVVKSGNGYNPQRPPTVEVQGTGLNAIIKTVVNDIGQVTGAYVESAGSGFTSVPKLVVRPYTVIVQTDAAANGFWTKFAWDQDSKEWTRVETQKFDTRLLWKYVDWQSPSYNPLQDFADTVAEPYELASLDVTPGTYVKVKNSGNGTFMVVRKTETGTIGTWDKNWDVVYEERGTIQIVDKIWNDTLTDYAFDEVAAFDQTLFDQSINQELVYLLRAIKDDLFVGVLKPYWNKFFFKAVKYALQEQQTLEWAFKTSFINVINNAGVLDQRPTYKLQDSSYYESWINEVKPYHTKIRNFTVKYGAIEDTNTFVSDFDLQPYYDSVNNSFITLSSTSTQVLQYPFRAWYDNYTNFVDSIVVVDQGSDYIVPPVVKIIPAPGDFGTGATAEAYISLGKVYEIAVTNPGTGYTVTPTVVLEGGLGLDGKQAKASARLGNGKVRSNNLTLKFDRISYNKEVQNIDVVDQFTGDGSTYEFLLTWIPQPDRNTIKLKQAGSLVLNDKFTIEYFEQDFTNTNGLTYSKKYARLVLSFVPVKNITLTLEYKKSVETFNAIDRIENYYAPEAGMPGKDPDQLMTGLSYGGVKVDTLPFSYSSAWDTLKWWEGAWDSYASETNYGVVKDPQLGYAGQLLELQTQASEADYEVGFWTSRIAQLEQDIAATSPFIAVGPNQFIPNPAYQYLLSQLAQAQGQLNYWTSRKNILDNQVLFLLAGNVPVTTPFTVSTGTFINVYLNTGTGINVRIDQTTSTAIIPTIVGQGSTATVYVPLTYFSTASSNVITFRDQSSDGTVLPADPDALDAVISGGDLDSVVLGIAPSDIVIDGYKFIDPTSSYAPEEMLPGQIQESVGISVFEQKPEASPVIVNRRFELGGSPTYPLGVKVASTASVFVLTDTKPLRYAVDYTVNPIANTITLTQAVPGATWLSVSAMTLGGVGLVDYQLAKGQSGTTSTVVVSAVALKNIKDAYVVVNGTEWTNFTIEVAPGRAKNKTPKGAIRVNHNSIGTKEIQVWIFNQDHKAYSQVHEQIFQNVNIQQDVFTLSQPPGVIEPHHSQVIVEWNGRRLLPPQVSYYVVEPGQLSFDVDPNDPLIAGQATLVNTEVYRNGEKLVPGVDFQLTPPPTRVLFPAEKIATGDAIAIAVLAGNEYKIENGQLILVNVPRALAGADTMRVITFTNHDGSKIRKERFAANKAGRYVMSRPIVNTNYVWVEYNGKPLINDLDYSVADDLVTVKLRDDFFVSSADKVVIMSLSDSSYNGAISYRMFTDILGRTSYKRLSSSYSTTLAQPLLATDSKIYVENAGVLTAPNPEKNLPGVVYIAGERVEFFKVAGNELSQLRRGTLGTGVLDGLPTGTFVIDQGRGQNLPVTDTTQIERFTSTVTTNVYTLTSITVTGALTKTWVDPETGIAQILDAPPLTDMFEVLYGGVPLLKPTSNPVVTTDTEIAYDSGQTNSVGTPSTSTVSAQFTMSSVIINNNEYPVLHFGFDVQPGVEVFVSKRTGQIFENTTVFTFLEETPGVLPSENYYSGDPIIILETGAVLTDEDETPLEGI